MKSFCWLLPGVLFVALPPDVLGQTLTTLTSGCSKDWHHGNYRECCRASGVCQSSSCKIFGYSKHEKKYCKNNVNNPNCIASVCSYFNTKCTFSGTSTSTLSLSTTIDAAMQTPRCYGYITCVDGTTNCEGAGELCLDDGHMQQFRICGDDSCPQINGSCPAPNVCPQNYYWDGSSCRFDKCIGVSCNQNEHCNFATGACDCDDGFAREGDGTCEEERCARASCSEANHEHCSAETGLCACDDGWKRVDGQCLVDQCQGVTCSEDDHLHCNPQTGGCDCNDGWERVDGVCTVDKCASIECEAEDHEHCNWLTGACACDDGFERIGDDCHPSCEADHYRDSHGDCQLDLCAEVTCAGDHEHCNAATGACDCNDGWERVSGSCVVDICIGVICGENEHCNQAVGNCDCNDGFLREGDECEADKCQGITCSEDDHVHCNPETGTCDCDDGWTRVDGTCKVDQCAAIKCKSEDHEHCSAATGTCECDDGYERAGSKCHASCGVGHFRDDDLSCKEHKCHGVVCNEDGHEHCHSGTGECHCNNGYERVDGICSVDKCAGIKDCKAEQHEHCDSATGTCACDDGYERVGHTCKVSCGTGKFRNSLEDCEDHKCLGVTCGANEHCHSGNGACHCDNGYERVDGVCVASCLVGHYRGKDKSCYTPQECPLDNSIWDRKQGGCVCLTGYMKNPVNATCDPMPSYPCIVNGEANIVKRKQGKTDDVVVGKMMVRYDNNTNSFVIAYALTNANYPDLKFRKVWPRLSYRAPKDFSVKRWDSKWLKEYSKDIAPTRYVEFSSLQVPEFVCGVAPDVKSLFLSTQLQLWEPSTGTTNYRTAAGYVDDGDVRSGRDRRDFRLVIHCAENAASCAGCGGQCQGAKQHCVWNVDGYTCQCDPGYVEAADGSGACVLEDACSLAADTCPENSSCQDMLPGAVCKCNQQFHERRNPVDGSLECVKKCVMNGATSLRLNTGASAGTVNILIDDNSPLSAPQYALTYTLSSGAGQIKSVYFQTGKKRADKHVPSLFPNSLVLKTSNTTLRYPTDVTKWLPLGGSIDCTAGVDNVFFVSTHLGIISGGAGQKAWGKGKKTDDANAQDFEFRVRCQATCPAQANCQGCHLNAECVWDPNASGDNKYSCACNPGYTGDGTTTCTDIDECAAGAPIVCGGNATCTNTVGSYTCNCASKMVFDGVLGCTASSTILKDADVEPIADPTVSSSDATCQTPGWVWIMVGVLVTALIISLAVIVVQFTFTKRQEVPFFTSDIAEPRGNEGVVPVPSAATCGFVSPSNVRRRESTPKNKSPLANLMPMRNGNYDPLNNRE